jgi:hypothetical protein
MFPSMPNVPYTPIPNGIVHFDNFCHGRIFLTPWYRYFKMIFDLPICTEPKKIYVTKYDHRIRKNGQFNWEWEYLSFY